MVELDVYINDVVAWPYIGTCTVPLIGRYLFGKGFA